MSLLQSMSQVSTMNQNFDHLVQVCGILRDQKDLYIIAVILII